MTEERNEDGFIDSSLLLEQEETNVKARAVYNNSTIAVCTPAGATGSEHNYRVIEGKTNGISIASPNTEKIKDVSFRWCDEKDSSSTSTWEKFYKGTTSSPTTNMNWLYEDDYIIIETTKICNIYAITINPTYLLYGGEEEAELHYFNGELKIEKLVNGQYVDYTAEVSQRKMVTNDIGLRPTYQLFISELPTGTWRFSKGENIRVDGYWYLEEVNNELKINKVFDEDVANGKFLEDYNEINFTDTGKLFTYTKVGEQIQIGCSREEYEELKNELENTTLQFNKFNQVKW